ncbi:MAG: uridine phosphorylase [Cyclobacteriaceae bacterium]|jgi:uridine phosphorylase
MAIKISDTDLIVNADGSVYHLNLKPHDISDIILTVGDPGRVHRISQHFDKVEFEMNKREFITHVGTYKGKRLTVLSTGMGTDNVEIVMQELDALVNINLKTRLPNEELKKLKIIRVGTSGSIQEDVRLGSHILSEYAIGIDPLMLYYPFEPTQFEKEVATAFQKETKIPYPLYCARGSNELIEAFRDLMPVGNTLTCNGFYAPQGRQLRVQTQYSHLVNTYNYFHYKDFWLTNLEMETAAYYGLGRVLGHETLSLNAILANRVRNKFSKDPNKVVDALIKKVLDRVTQL